MRISGGQMFAEQDARQREGSKTREFGGSRIVDFFASIKTLHNHGRAQRTCPVRVDDPLRHHESSKLLDLFLDILRHTVYIISPSLCWHALKYFGPLLRSHVVFGLMPFSQRHD